MSEEKMYAVKNDEGKYWDFYSSGFWKPDSIDCITTPIKKHAELVIKYYGGHVVTLIEASKPVEVSEKEAKMLATLMDGDLMPVCELSYFVRHAEQLPEKESIEREDRLMRAYVNGYTVEKPKRYVMPMPYGADDDDPDYSHYAVVNREYHAGPAWYQGPCVSFNEAREHYSVTQADIDASPDWVKAITPLEVTDDE